MAREKFASALELAVQVAAEELSELEEIIEQESRRTTMTAAEGDGDKHNKETSLQRGGHEKRS